MKRWAVIVAILTAATALAPLAAADPFVCFVNVDNTCMVGYDTPPTHDSCSDLRPGDAEQEVLFVDEGIATVHAGHECAHHADGSTEDVTFVDAARTHVGWGEAWTSPCDVVASNDMVHVETGAPCPAGQRLPDILP